ncbi:MAG: DUF4493 domain-containing protein [Bacteroidales bacterium]|nr:DUF4493 domain-containing protein [Bacteroidales bacterium]
MKRGILVPVLALLALAGCKETFLDEPVRTGYLSFADFSIEGDDAVDVSVSKARIAAPGSSILTVVNAQGETVLATTYAEARQMSGGVELPIGNYELEVRTGEVPAAAFEQPVYGAAEKFKIEAGRTTAVSPVVCTLLQVAVTVSYEDALLEMMSGDGKTDVEVVSGAPLSYFLRYDNGNVSCEERRGYFSLESGSTTMLVSFTGIVNGSNQKMTKMFTGIEPAQLRQVKFVKKVNDEGTATIDILVDGYVEDEELLSYVVAPLPATIGEDPDAPKGDGGITLTFAPDCTMYSDLSHIVVPAEAEGGMDLRLVATVPAGLQALTVRISSTNDVFMQAVSAAGGAELDLIHPSEASEIVFQVVPFPHGPSLIGQTELLFDLSAAQVPLLGFPGTHTFMMVVRDANACRKEIPVVLVVR